MIILIINKCTKSHYLLVVAALTAVVFNQYSSACFYQLLGSRVQQIDIDRYSPNVCVRLRQHRRIAFITSAAVIVLAFSSIVDDAPERIAIPDNQSNNARLHTYYSIIPYCKVCAVPTIITIVLIDIWCALTCVCVIVNVKNINPFHSNRTHSLPLCCRLLQHRCSHLYSTLVDAIIPPSCPICHNAVAVSTLQRPMPSPKKR